ncbi:MAG: hypothetical protein HQK59_05440, partial [Deltaproteobacteria bacterium]|nr:hypothetical protein [Deltaproteobacteria bacterium]
IRGKVHSVYFGKGFNEETAKAKIAAKMDKLSQGLVAEPAKDEVMGS